MALLRHLLYTNLPAPDSGQPQVFRLTPGWTADATAALERWLSDLRLLPGVRVGWASQAFNVGGARQAVLALVLGEFGADEAGRRGVWLSHALIVAADDGRADFGGALLRDARQFERWAQASQDETCRARLDAYVARCRDSRELAGAAFDVEAWRALPSDLAAQVWSQAERGAVDGTALAAGRSVEGLEPEHLSTALSPLPPRLRLAAPWTLHVQAPVSPDRSRPGTAVSARCAAHLRALLQRGADNIVGSWAHDDTLMDWPAWESALAAGSTGGLRSPLATVAARAPDRSDSEVFVKRQGRSSSPVPVTPERPDAVVDNDLAVEDDLAQLDEDGRAIAAMSRAYVDKRLDHISAALPATGAGASRLARAWPVAVAAVLVLQIGLLVGQWLLIQEVRALRAPSVTDEGRAGEREPSTDTRTTPTQRDPQAPATPPPATEADLHRVHADQLVKRLATEAPLVAWRAFVEQHPADHAAWLRAVAGAQALARKAGAQARVTPASSAVATACADEIARAQVPEGERLQACALVLFEYAHARQHAQATVDGDIARVRPAEVKALLAHLGIQASLVETLGAARADDAREVAVQVAVAAHWVARQAVPKEPS